MDYAIIGWLCRQLHQSYTPVIQEIIEYNAVVVVYQRKDSIIGVDDRLAVL